METILKTTGILTTNPGLALAATPGSGLTEPETERELILRCQRGDRQAFETVYLRYHRGLFLFLLSMLRSHHNAEDLVQDVFVKLFSDIRSFRFQSSFGHWLFRVARNAAIDKFRREKLRRAQSLDAESEDLSPLKDRLAAPGPWPSDKPENDELRRAIDRALEKLPKNHRTALMMREWEDMKYEEISSRLRISTGTVKSRIFRARKMMAGELESKRMFF